jgi:DNA polymerase III epsilon subunit-like protein
MKSKIIKLAFIDTETTGLDPILNDPVQIAIVYKELILHHSTLNRFSFSFTPTTDHKVFYLKPINFDSVSQKALDINGFSIEKLNTFPDAKIVFTELIAFLDSKVKKYDKTDKLFPAGYSVKFDMDMLFSLANKLHFNYLGSYFSRKTIDVYDHFRHLSLLFPSAFNDDIKLKTVCEICSVPLVSAHDALSDITASISLFTEIMLPQLSLIQNSDLKIAGKFKFL